MRSKLFLAGLLLAVSAAAQDVRYNFDDQADFSKYHTYRWEKHPQTVEIDEITANQLRTALSAELAKKGLTEAQSGAADLTIVYQIALKNEKELTTYNSGWGYGPGWRTGGWYGGGGGFSSTTTDTITIGALATDLYDSAKKHLVWRGVVTKTLDEKAKPDKRQKNFAKAAEKLFKNYPPKKKS